MKVKIGWSSIILLLALCSYWEFGTCARKLKAASKIVSPVEIEGKVITGQRGKALFLVKNGEKLMFPDFFTFSKMGYDSSVITKVSEEVLHGLPVGDPIPKIQAPPPFRPDDYMYHAVCEDPDRLVGLLPCLHIY
jgi:hypothetical protein